MDMHDERTVALSPEEITHEQWCNITPKYKWLYTPHRFFFLFAFVAILVFVNAKTNFQKVVTFWFMAVFTLAMCLQDGPLIRPHPFIWRLVLAFALMNIITTLGLCLLDREKIIELIGTMGPSGKVEYAINRDYSIDCTIYDRNNPSDPFHNVKPVVFDEFVPGHFFGWVLTSFLLRDTKVCWILSIVFEFAERALKHWFPNFNECWWDSVILDVVICNALGIWLGMKLVNYLVLVPWEKRLIGDCRGVDKIMRVLKQFTPRDYTVYDWQPLKTPKRYYMTWFVVGMIVLLQMNLFAIKMIFKIELQNIFLMLLLGEHMLHAMPAIMEAYLYVSDQTNTMGNFPFTQCLQIFCEVLLIIKCRDGYFTEPVPLKVKIGAPLFFLLVLVIFPFFWFVVLKKGDRKKKAE